MAEIRPPEGEMNGGGVPMDTVGSKRLRRPSVRLGDIGDQPLSRTNKQHHSFDPKNASGKSSKIRPLINFSATADYLEDDDKIENLDSVAIGSWKAKRRGSNGAKRVRSNWVPKIDEIGDDFGVQDSASPLKEQSPLHSLENDREGLYRRPITIRASVDMSVPSDNDARDWKRNDREDGVRIWLDSLGLGRYAPVFEIHEVDDQVLQMLTLEDLRDMGITAVGSRRKMYCAIQKLRKGFS